MKRVLVVDDEESLLDLLILNFQEEGFDTKGLLDGFKVLDTLKSEHFDVLVLDIMLPGMTGLEVCEKIRVNSIDIPIIFLTARDNPMDKIKGLKVGADDYLVKPFLFEELLLRVNNLIKRSDRKESDLGSFTFGPNTVVFSSYEAQTEKGTIHLTRKELNLLKLFIAKKNQVVSRELILKQVWGYDVFPSTRTIDNFILSFRKYFEKDPTQPEYFKSIRGVGYMFND
jgi:two-component system alkaline phosphatase synthesis response regulator PhoP